MDRTIEIVLATKGREIVHVHADASVDEAASLMRDARVGSLLVFGESKLVGILSERDVVTRVVAAGLDPRATRVAEVMTAPARVIEPTATVGTALSICTHHRVRHLPVVQAGEVIGLISSGDLAKALTDDLTHEVEELTRYITNPFVH